MKKRIVTALFALLLCLTLVWPASAETNTDIPMDRITTNGTPGFYNKEKGWITFYDDSSAEYYILDRKTGLRVSEYDICCAYSDGMALVAKREVDGELYAGFIDLEGNLAIPLRYNIEAIFQFSDGLAPYIENGAIGFIDKTGAVAIPPISADTSYLEYEVFSEGLACIRVDDSGLIESGICEYIDTKGNVVLPPSENYGGPFSEGMATYRLKVNDYNYKYGFIDKSGEVVIPAKYDYVSSFINGRACVGKTGDTGKLYGYIDLEGNEVIPCRYTSADDFVDEIALVGDGEGQYFIDKEENVILSEIDCRGVRFSYFGNDREKGLISVDSDKGSGFINIKGDIVVPATYEDSGILFGIDEDNPDFTAKVSDTLFWVKNGDDYYFFDSPYQDGKDVGSTVVPSALIAVGLLVAVGLVGIAVAMNRKKKAAATVEVSIEQLTEAPSPSEANYNFCPSCGTKLPENSKFCPNCGRKM